MDVTLDAEGQLQRVSAVDDATLAKEKAQQVMGLAQQHGGAVARQLLARVGAPTLGALALLAVAWWWLPILSVQVAASFKQSATLAQLLALVNQSRDLSALGASGSAGIYGLLMWLAWLAPLAPHALPDRRLHLAGAAPLVFMLAAGVAAWWGVRSSVAQAREAAGAFGGGQAAAMAQQMVDQMMASAWAAVSLGLGSYLGLAAALYLAVTGLRRYLVAASV